MSELIQTLKEAQYEIKQLRRQNEILSAKVEVMDNFMLILHTTPANRLTGASPDVVYAMENEINKLEAAAKPQASP
jgi:hypothetical protein